MTNICRCKELIAFFADFILLVTSLGTYAPSDIYFEGVELPIAVE